MPYQGDDEDAKLRARLSKLSGDLKGRGAAPPPPPEGAQPRADGTGSAMAMGMRAGSEFVAAIIVGTGIGWVIDRALGTKPAFLIVFFMIGVAAGVWNVIRATSPKGGSSDRNSPLSRAEPPDKDLRRSPPGAGQDVLHSKRGASDGAAQAPGGVDDDED
ncbi:MAG: AtpZ/AtpI family protein [Hyphomicrobiales bacterium]|nr:AtpZ/AtpI family protein [Hyphomicrobiales bacterium]MBV8441344.1 AtpZ/AtpI family protein [Hyphomicrobiales bacterium]